MSFGTHLQVEWLPNEETTVSSGRTAVVGIDLWEHAYCLKYQDDKEAYVNACFKVIDWEYISGRYIDSKSN